MHDIDSFPISDVAGPALGFKYFICAIMALGWRDKTNWAVAMLVVF
jgi:hypothetical protein